MSKIYSKSVQAMSGSDFPTIVVRKKDGTSVKLSGIKAKDFVVNLAHGGKLKSSIERKLKEAGVNSSQYDKRNRIMKTISGEESHTEKRQRILASRAGQKASTRYEQAETQFVRGNTRTSSRVTVEGRRKGSTDDLGVVNAIKENIGNFALASNRQVNNDYSKSNDQVKNINNFNDPLKSGNKNNPLVGSTSGMIDPLQRRAA